jgi:hypothetical protein
MFSECPVPVRPWLVTPRLTSAADRLVWSPRNCTLVTNTPDHQRCLGTLPLAVETAASAVLPSSGRSAYQPDPSMTYRFDLIPQDPGLTRLASHDQLIQTLRPRHNLPSSSFFDTLPSFARLHGRGCISSRYNQPRILRGCRAARDRPLQSPGIWPAQLQRQAPSSAISITV